MKLHRYIVIGTLALAAAGSSAGAWSPRGGRTAGPSARLAALEAADDQNEKKKDPAYDLYKSGYQSILNEEWEQARTKFRELLDKYGKGGKPSSYCDDASYWSAFALEHMQKDKEKSLKAFREFISAYPESNYFDDAVAEIQRLKEGWTESSAPYAVGIGQGVWSVVPRVAESPGRAMATNRTLAALETKLRATHSRMGRTLRVPTVGTPVPVPLVDLSGRDIDPETKIKMDALNAIGETKEDSISFRTLRDVAVDPRQPISLRESAMNSLAEFSRFDVQNVFLEVARKDTSEEIQNMAIDYMGQVSKNKNRSFESLAELYSAIPRTRVPQLETVLSSIAEIGNDKSVDFLARVAKTDENYELRSQAVYYLGNIGGDRARAALYEILKGK